MTPEKIDQVECFSGHTYAQRPVAFVWQGQRYEVTEVEAEWNSPEGKRFRVRTPDELRFDLLYLISEDEWLIEAY